jgi:hypothetical protein
MSARRFAGPTQTAAAFSVIARTGRARPEDAIDSRACVPSQAWLETGAVERKCLVLAQKLRERDIGLIVPTDAFFVA